MAHTTDATTQDNVGESRIPKGLYRVGGAAALIAALVFRRNWGAEFVMLRALGVIRRGPAAHPTSVSRWFELLQSSRFIGLTLFNLFDLVNYALVGLILLALYAALRRASESIATLGAACGLVGIAVYFASNQAFAMLTLSERHAAAATETRQAAILAAGEALLAIENPGTMWQGLGSQISLLLVTVASVMMAFAMVRSKAFKPRTGYVGLVAEVAQLGGFLALAGPPALAAVPSSIAGLFRLVWYILVGRRLWRLAQGGAAGPRCRQSG